MRIKRSLRRASVALTSAMLLLVAGCGDENPAAPGEDSGAIAPGLAISGAQGVHRHLVILQGAEGSNFAAEVAALGGQVERRHGAINLVTVTGLNDLAAARLAARSDVSRIRRDVKVQWIPRPNQMVFRIARSVNSRPPTAQGTDQSGAFFFPIQWNLRKINADQAWPVTNAGAGALVCVLDTGIDPDHIDLAGKVDLNKSASMVPDEPSILDRHFHGTHVASIVSSNGLGVASVASDARLCAVKVLNREGRGSFGDIIAGIIHAADQGADVINMSLGAYIDKTGAADFLRVLQSSIDHAVSKGTLVVASGGNDAINLDQDPPQFIHIPSQLNNVSSIGATGPINQQEFDRLASYSNFGGRTGIDLVAPGGDFLAGIAEDFIIGACSQYQIQLPFSCVGGNFFLFVVGTSQASPHVAGVAAVVESQFAGNQNAAQLERCVFRGVDRVGSFTRFGRGRANVLKAAAC